MESNQNHMPVSLSVKNVPEAVAKRLRQRARRNRRSLQGELLAILEQAATPDTPTLREVLEQAKKLGLETPDEAAAMIREDRDSR